MTAQQLKNSILQLAVQGKLVPQDPNDEPASVLLERIRAEKQQLIKEKKIKPEKNPSYIFRGTDNTPYEKIGNSEPVSIADQVPFEIPESWEWERIGNIFTLQAGKSIKSAEIVDTPFPNSYPCYGGNGIRGFVSNKNRKGDFPIIGRQGALCGNIKRAKGEFYATEHAVCVETYAETSVEWTCFFLTALNLNQYATATAQPGLAVSNINRIIIPIPPLAEQHRIAAKIEELLPYVEKYEQVENQLSALNTAFPELLKKSIFQEAVMGKLVPQNPDDEPASVLLDCIRAEKQELIKQGKIKPDKHESIIFKRDNSHYERIGNIERCIDDELPFEIPENWEWCRASYIGTMLRGKGIKRNETVKEGTPCVRYGEIYTTYNYSFAQTVSFIPAEIDSKCIHFGYGDILFTLTGENKVDIAKAVTYLGKSTVAAGGDLAIWTTHGMNPMFLVYFMASPYCIDQKQNTSTGDIIVHISTSKVGHFLVPIPPLAEQHRIVAKIEELMKYWEML